MKMQHWRPVLVWGVLLFGGIDQGWAQPKCESEVRTRCVHPAEVGKSTDCNVRATGDCAATCRRPDGCSQMAVAGCERKVGVACEQKTCVQCERGCGAGQSPKLVLHPRPKGAAAEEPRKLALPCGTPKRLTVCDSPKPGYFSSLGNCGPCQTDCRRDTIFGTETIFGNVSPGFFFDTTPQKAFICCPRICGQPNGKGTVKGRGKSDCGCDAGHSPILQGRPEEPDWNGNPFRDDSVEPAPLRPLPRVSEETSAARQVPTIEPPANLRVTRAKPVSSYSAPASYEVERLRISDWLPNPLLILD